MTKILLIVPLAAIAVALSVAFAFAQGYPSHHHPHDLKPTPPPLHVAAPKGAFTVEEIRIVKRRFARSYFKAPIFKRHDVIEKHDFKARVFKARVVIENHDVSAREIVATVTSLKPGVRIIDSKLRFGDVDGGAQATSRDTFSVFVQNPGIFSPVIDLGFTFSSIPPRFLTEGGNLAPRPDEPEFGEPGYSATYYGKVDPSGERTNLADWKQANVFNEASIAFRSARYINAYDLGFGRHMNCMDNGRASCYVDNYLLERDTDGIVVPGGEELFAASVAMERIMIFGRVTTAFFVFAPVGGPTSVRPSDLDLVRTNQIELDNEGPKAVPESCYACHFGFTTAGGNPSGGNYLPWDLDILDNWPGQPSLASQADEFRRLNQTVWSDANIGSPPRKASLRDLIEAWYEGPPFIGTNFNGNRLPENSWYDLDIRTGACDLDAGLNLISPEKCNRFTTQRFMYNNVYARFCRSCHVAQGPTQDVNIHNDGLDWRFGEVFHDQAYYQICDKSSRLTMPHAELTFQRFHGDLINFTDGTSTTAAERLCDRVPSPTYVHRNLANASAGEALFNTSCTSCHTVRIPSAGFPSDADLTCKGGRVFKTLALVDGAMAGVSLNDQQVANVRRFLDTLTTDGGTPLCPPSFAP